MIDALTCEVSNALHPRPAIAPGIVPTLLALLAAVVVGGSGYLAMDLRQVQHSVEASAETAELRELARLTHLAAHTVRDGGDEAALPSATAATRVQFDIAVNGVAEAVDDAHAEAARLPLGKALDEFITAAARFAAGDGDGMEIDNALLVLFDELDAISTVVSSGGLARTGELGRLLLIAGLAGAAGTVLLAVGWQRSRASLTRSDRLLRMQADASAANNIRPGPVRLRVWEWSLASDEIKYLDETIPIPDSGHRIEYTGETFLNLIYPDDRELVQAFAERAGRDGRPYEVEYRFVLADGTTTLARDAVEVIPAERGGAPTLRGTNYDISTTTMMVRANAALLGSDERFRRSLAGRCRDPQPEV
ncbi:MAG: PAS domain-containing protein [Dehalococcoidia bacterium]|jgi:hypothetical protein|nr:PAS domain-containing protein [Dehalococcoidia bacterium]